MNRKLVIPAIFAAALAIPATASASQGGQPVGTVAAAVDCNTFTIDVVGLEPNEVVYAEVGAEPPYLVDIATGHATLNISVAEQGTEFWAAVGLSDPDSGIIVWPFQQTVDCSQTVKVALPQQADPLPDQPGVSVAETPVTPVVANDEPAPVVEAVVFGNYQMAPPEV